jgi:hypothetical protein
VIITIMMIVIEEYKRRGRFDAYLEDGRWLCRSATPLLDASRKLLTEGLPPETPIAMRHKNSTTISLRSTIGAAAKLCVEHSQSGRPIFRKYHAKGVTEPEDEEILAEELSGHPAPPTTQP